MGVTRIDAFAIGFSGAELTR